jgi:glutaconate CoA-transferase subunit B
MADEGKRVLRPGSDPVAFFRYPDEGRTGAISRGHMMAAAIAGALQDGEVVIMGANPLLPLAGSRLAQLTHAPNLTLIVGPSGGVNTLVDPLAPSAGDYSNLVAEAVLDFPDVLTLQVGGRTDVFFAGGLQIDRRGNCNLALVGDPKRPTLRGPGSAGIPWAHSSRRTILYATSHTQRVFVPKVDFVSLAGWPEPVSPDLRGPDLVVTPLAVLDFTPQGDMRLVSVHPGVTVQEALDTTGFDLTLPESEVPATPEPTEEQLRIMRDFDPDGLLSIVI